MLQTFDPDKLLIIETDISDYTTAGIVSQEGQFLEFISKKMNQAKQNYMIFKKEMMTVIQAIKEWRKYLKDSHGQPDDYRPQKSNIFQGSSNHKSKTDQMDSWNTEYIIQVGIPEGKRKHCGWYTDEVKRKRKTVNESDYISTSDNSETSQKERISFFNESVRIKTNGKIVILLRTTDHEIVRGKGKDHLVMSQWWKSRTFRDQENTKTDIRNGILGLQICSRMLDLSKERKKPKNGTQRPDKQVREDIKSSIYWTYHKITKDQRKRYYLGHPRPILGDHISESDK